jgi:phosphatidylserine decarboxylase
MTPRILLQYALPHRFLSRIVYYATRWTWRPWKNFLINRIVQGYDVDMAEAIEPDPFAYPHFNAFFTRALRPDARPEPPDPRAIACPADGYISQIGAIDSGRICQAKGQTFSVAELLADADAADTWREGHFATIYLSPRDYHRVHMPLAGALQRTTHVPGRIFSVAPFTVAAIPRLFARNERLVCHFRGEHGPFAVVMVGAMLVSSIETVWDGLVIPPYAGRVTDRDRTDTNVHLARGEQMGRFNMGSTVIVLVGASSQIMSLRPEQRIIVGDRLGAF